MECPFCKEEILDGALKCRHCGSMLTEGAEAVLQPMPAFAMPYPDTAEYQQQKVDNTLVWILAFAPILGAILQYLLKETLGDGWILRFPTLALNVILVMADRKKLQQQGYDTSSFGNVLLIPSYLYRRAKKLNHNFAYFVVWMVCFILLIL